MKRAQPSTFRKRGSLLQRIEALERCPLYQHHDWEHEAVVDAWAQLSLEDLDFIHAIDNDRKEGIDRPVTPREIELCQAYEAALVVARDKRGLPPLRRAKKRR